MTEEENIDLNTTSLNIEFIVKVLRRALEDPSHYSAHYNFFAVEVVEAVQRVAANDDNKVIMKIIIMIFFCLVRGVSAALILFFLKAL